MTPRDLLIGVWPWSLPDETASQGADMVLKALDAAGYVIIERAEIERLRAEVEYLKCQNEGLLDRLFSRDNL